MMSSLQTPDVLVGGSLGCWAAGSYFSRIRGDGLHFGGGQMQGRVQDQGQHESIEYVSVYQV